MANLDDVLIFVKVAQFESISRAGRSLGMPISTVSRRLSVLESKLGVSLLRRTTRRVTLTAQGREYFNQCREPLALMEEAERVLTLGQTQRSASAGNHLGFALRRVKSPTSPIAVRGALRKDRNPCRCKAMPVPSQCSLSRSMCRWFFGR
jgi:DNA-binding transcriptional LysR family regulator